MELALHEGTYCQFLVNGYTSKESRQLVRH